MRRTFRTVFALPVALLLAFSSVAAADFTQPTLERIKETGKIRIGYGAAAPFSFMTADGHIMGYSIDLCNRVVEKLKTRLDLPSIEIVYLPRTPSNRVQMLNSGEIDLECSASTNTPERRKMVNFAVSHFYCPTRYVSLAKNNLNTLADLKGRSVSVALGTVNVSYVNEANRTKKLNISVVPVDSIQAAFDMVTNGRVSAFAMDEVLLRTMIARAQNPDDYSVSVEKVMEAQPFGFMMRLNDSEFATAINEALTEIYESSEMSAIYRKWFESPVPEIGVNINLSMSTMMGSGLERPTIEP